MSLVELQLFCGTAEQERRRDEAPLCRVSPWSAYKHRPRVWTEGVGVFSFHHHQKDGSSRPRRCRFLCCLFLLCCEVRAATYC